MNASMLFLFLTNIAIAEDTPDETEENEKTEDAEDSESADDVETEKNIKNIRIRPIEEEQTTFDGFRLRAKMGMGRYGFLQKEKGEGNNELLPVDSSFIATTIPFALDMEFLVKNMVTIDASLGLSPFRVMVVDDKSLQRVKEYSIGAKYRHPVSESIFVEGGVSYGSIGSIAFLYDNDFSDIDIDQATEKGVALRTAAITSVKGVDLRLSLEEYFTPVPSNTKLVFLGDYAFQPLEIPSIDSELLLSAALELDWHHFPYTSYSETVSIRGFQRNFILGAGILW
jgi:hypothetical protein